MYNGNDRRFTIRGKVLRVSEVTQRQNITTRKLLVLTDEKHPQSLPIEAVNEKALACEQIYPGDMVECGVKATSRIIPPKNGQPEKYYPKFELIYFNVLP